MGYRKPDAQLAWPILYKSNNDPHRQWHCLSYWKCLCIACDNMWSGWACPKKCDGFVEKSREEIEDEDRKINSFNFSGGGGIPPGKVRNDW